MHTHWLDIWESNLEYPQATPGYLEDLVGKLTVQDINNERLLFNGDVVESQAGMPSPFPQEESMGFTLRMQSDLADLFYSILSEWFTPYKVDHS